MDSLMEIGTADSHDCYLQVLMLVKNSGETIPSAQGWKTVCLLISSTGLSPEACATALEALHIIGRSPVLCSAAFLPCLECVAAFVENQNKVLTQWNCPRSEVIARGRKM